MPDSQPNSQQTSPQDLALAPVGTASNLKTWRKFQVHADDEALYILAGECLFGFVGPDGSQIELIVQAEEYINVPAGTEHWFCLTASLHIKALRYFTTVGGWTPQYTDTEIYFRQPVARRYRGDRR